MSDRRTSRYLCLILRHKPEVIGITLDERIADGYYYSKTIRLLHKILQNPEILDRPAKEEVDYE